MAQWIAHIHGQGIFAILVANMGKLFGDSVQRLFPGNRLPAVSRFLHWMTQTFTVFINIIKGL